ncbi:hypothetical protein R5H32_12540 [Defluviimonas sp. D31]|uniref:hypothetical protein n=1 Tax=Defluviimonas sp. D31 TaxID=3083253 RepID=UPI00296FDB8B|nr:hypothetical protein [Defluviimonas sp. D31]MDW4550183.1 hypothetical protein [Defluviimonas sp. D31]
MKHAILTVAALAASLPSVAFGDDYDLDALRASTEKYKDVNVALAEGFIPDPSGHCVSAAHEGLPAEWGAMGIHYLRPDLLGIMQGTERVDGTGTHTDFNQPAILLYEPQADGSMELVGIENLVFEKAWMEAGNTEGPLLNGRPWDHMSDDPNTAADEAHGFMPHFDQHVWLFRENPSGELNPFNPNVTCDHHSG